MRRLALLLLLAAFAGCSTPRNPYYPHIEEARRVRREPLTAPQPSPFLRMIVAALSLVAAKNT